MLITIYDSTGIKKADVEPNDSSTHVKEVQGDSVLTLSFTHYAHIALDVDDYVDFEGERFWLTERYRAKQNARKEWAYDLKLYGVESLLKRLLVIKTVDGEDEPVFTLTAPPREHLALIVGCMNEGLGNITDWKVGTVTGTENIVIDYFGKYCDEALREIAEKVGAEAWVDGETVNICKCEHGEPITMGYGKGLLSIDPGMADNVKFYTRLYPVGSSRNIDRDKYGFTRLQLPGGLRYVEINADKYGRVDHYEQDAFASIYPHRMGTVSSVRSEVKTGEDGNEFTVYYFKDDDLSFDPNDYEIGGLVKRVSFQEGSELGGLGNEDNGTYYFEVNYDSVKGEFEIITIWPYGDDTQLPGGVFVPKAGDKYILWNISMPDEYYTLAEEEFLEAVEKYNAEHEVDISLYRAPTDHVWIEENEVELRIGQRIRLESSEYFPDEGFRDSRITKITRRVNLPSQMDIEFGDALSRTSLDKVRDELSGVESYAKSIEQSLSLPDIIKTGDRTRATDNNLLSARRTYNDLLRKDQRDRTAYGLASDEGFEAGRFVSGVSGAAMGIDPTTGGSYMESDRLFVRQMATFMQMVINELTVTQGDQLFTEGDTVESAEFDGVNADGTERWWVNIYPRHETYTTSLSPGMILTGTVNNLYDAALEGAPGTYYTSYMRVNGPELGTSGNRLNVTLYGDDEVLGGRNFPPCALMTLGRWGHQTEEIYQRLFRLSSHEGTLIRYEGVNKPIIDFGNVASFIGRCQPGWFDNVAGVKVGDEIAYFKTILGNFIQIDHRGMAVPTYVYTGQYDPEREYHCDYRTETGGLITETCTYYGCIWQAARNGIKGIAPDYGTTAWAFREGNPEFTVDFEEKAVCYSEETLATFGATLTLTARMYNQDVLSRVKAYQVTWSRESYDEHGALRAASDALWEPTTDRDNKRLLLTAADLDYDGTPLGRVTFTARVAIDDTEVAEASMEFA